MSEFLDIAFTPSEEAAICLKCKLPSCCPSRCKDWDKLRELRSQHNERTRYVRRRKDYN